MDKRPKLAILGILILASSIAVGATYIFVAIQSAKPRTAVGFKDVCVFDDLDLDDARKQYELVARNGFQEVAVGASIVRVPLGLLPVSLRSKTIKTSGLLIQLKLPNFLPNLTADGVFESNNVHLPESPVVRINLAEKRSRYIGHKAMLALYKLTNEDGIQGPFGLAEFQVPDGVPAPGRSLFNYDFEDGSRLFIWCSDWELPAPGCRTTFTDHDALEVFYSYKRVHLCNWKSIHEHIMWLVA